MVLEESNLEKKTCESIFNRSEPVYFFFSAPLAKPYILRKLAPFISFVTSFLFVIFINLTKQPQSNHKHIKHYNFREKRHRIQQIQEKRVCSSFILLAYYSNYTILF